MRKTFGDRLAALERATTGGMTIPIVIVDEDGRTVGAIPAEPMQPFDWDVTMRKLLGAMSNAEEF